MKIATRLVSILTLAGAFGSVSYGCSVAANLPYVAPAKDAGKDAKTNTLVKDAQPDPQDSDPPPFDAGKDATKDATPDAPVTCLDDTQEMILSSIFTAPKAKQGACSTTQVSDFATACLGTSATQTACDTFMNGNLICTACLEGNASGGPVPAIYPISSTYVSANLIGCGYLVVGKPECALTAINLHMCSRSICESCSAIELAACVAEAEATYCSAYTPSKTCSDAYTAGKSQIDATCGGTAFDAIYKNVANYMCGK